ncbi:MAG: hypothetical protein LBO66_01645 [Deltaproteobacteria bacterium]|jgi:uncharacterized phage-associated protein|nr:hypothetical protein [Deltaproteobacteria bacterium]
MRNIKHIEVFDLTNYENKLFKIITPKMNFSGDDGLPDYMESFWTMYSKIKPWELVAASHAKGSPWKVVFSASDNILENPIIPIELMKIYFTELLEEKN